ncbi:MAG TPA: ABC transporter permease, partial [Cyclobacteriaceae bacterium]|nr:ABC transporter permease [Cyclobacteriaceae bacterium]
MKGFGRYMIFLGSLFVRRESFKTYYNLTLEECVQIGLKSILLFMLVSSFMGAVTTLQTGANLVSPFVPRFIISNVVREMTILELAPTIMAVIYAGKVGSSMAGGLGTMRITEQIDTLKIMEVNAPNYLIFPKIIAFYLIVPVLVIFSMFT